jgi:DNA invertase Pin-like site-specific DNA recombinase
MTLAPHHLDDDGEPWLGYIRVSTWKEEKISPELQRDAILEWAQRTGRRIVDWIIDLDESGRTFKRKVMRGIERVEGGEAYGIAVWRYSRFGRDRTGNQANLARLQQAGGQLESATEPVDASTAVGRFQRGMILEFAAYESDRAGEAWRETHNHRKYKLGLPAQGRKRFGYKWHRRWNPVTRTLQKEWYEPLDDQGRAIADRYREYVARDGFTTLVSRLNAAGFVTTQGTLWSTETLTRYMDSGFPAGLLRVHDPDCRCARTDGHCRNRVYIQGAHTELIDYDLWRAYLARRAEVRATAPRSRTGLYDLTGLPKCAGCRGGTSLNAQDGKAGWAYRCSRRAKVGPMGCDGVWIPRLDVERAARAWLAEEAAGIDAAPAGDLDPQPDAEDEQARTAKVRARLQAEVDKQRAAAARLRADHAANPDDYGPGEYEDALAEIRRKRAEAEYELTQVPVVEPLPTRAEVLPVARGVLREWDALSTRDRNSIYRALLRRIVLHRGSGGADTVRIEFHPRWRPDPWAPIPGEVVRKQLAAAP